MNEFDGIGWVVLFGYAPGALVTLALVGSAWYKMGEAERSGYSLASRLAITLGSAIAWPLALAFLVVVQEELELEGEK